MANSTFFPRLLIGIFAAAIVALGAREIHKKYGQISVSQSDRDTLIENLVGATHIERGRFEVQKAPNENVLSGENNQLGQLIDALTPDQQVEENQE